MLTLEQTKAAIIKALSNPAQAHLTIRLPELYASVDKHFSVLNLSQEQWDALAGLYTKLALEHSPIKAKITPKKLKELGVTSSASLDPNKYPLLAKLL